MSNFITRLFQGKDSCNTRLIEIADLLDEMIESADRKDQILLRALESIEKRLDNLEKEKENG